MAQTALKQVSQASNNGFLSEITVLVRTGSLANQNTTLASDPEMRFWINANETWQWEIAAFFQTSSSANQPGCKISMTGPSSPSKLYYLMQVTENGGLAQSNVAIATAYGTTAAITNSNFSPWTMFASVHGFVQNGSTPGYVNFQFAQNVSRNLDLNFLPPSFLIARRLA